MGGKVTVLTLLLTFAVLTDGATTTQAPVLQRADMSVEIWLELTLIEDGMNKTLADYVNTQAAQSELFSAWVSSFLRSGSSSAYPWLQPTWNTTIFQLTSFSLTGDTTAVLNVTTEKPSGKDVMDGFSIATSFNDYARLLGETAAPDYDLVSINEANFTVTEYTHVASSTLPKSIREDCSEYRYCGEIPMAECVGTGETFWCDCQAGYIEPNGNDSICYKTVSTLNTACTICERNGGTCHETAIEGTVGCHCPNTQGGTNCDNSYGIGTGSSIVVKVDCQSANMTICITPFDSNYTRDEWFAAHDLAALLREPADQSPSPAYIYVNTRLSQQVCTFRQATTSSGHPCKPGDWYLHSSTRDADLNKCAVYKFRKDGKLTYSQAVTIAVPDVAHSVAFNAQCVFQELIREEPTQHLEISAPILGTTGTYKSATVVMSLLDTMHAPISAVVPEGDRFFIQFRMADLEGIYQAITVESCFVSSEPYRNDMRATTKPLIVGGCPAERQSFLKLSNNFRQFSTDPTRLITGPDPIRAFRIGAGNIVYFHCTIRLCRDWRLCLPNECAGAGTKIITHRRRREVEESQIYLSHPLTLQAHSNPHKHPRHIRANEGSNSTGEPNAGFMALSLLFVLVVIAILTVSNRLQRLEARINDTLNVKARSVPNRT